MTRLNDFATNPAANAMFASYPPGMALFQYLLQRLFVLTNGAGDFCEWRCYYAYHVLLIGSCFPFLKRNGKIHQSLLVLVTFFLLPTAFYMAYYDLSIEIAIAVLTGSALARILLEREQDVAYSAYIFLSCAVVALLKDAGLLFAVFIGFSYVIDLLFRHKTGFMEIVNDAKRQVGIVKSILLTICSVAVPKLVWNIQLKITDTQLKFPQTVSIKTLLMVLIGRDESYRQGVMRSFIKALFQRSVLIDSPWSSSPLVQPAWKASYLCLALIFIMVLFALNKVYCSYVVHGSEKDESDYLRRKILTVIYTLLAAVYIIGIGAAYISNFSQHEAEILAAFSRYVQLPFLIFYIIIMLYLIKIGFCMRKWTSLICAGVCVTALCISPKIYVINYVDRTYVEQSYTRRQKYENLGNIIKNHCTADDRVCFIDQYSWLYPYVTIKFDVRPIDLGLVGNWSSWFLTEGYLQDNPEQLLDVLNENYDYLAIYQVDEYLVNTYSELFDSKVVGESLWITKSYAE